MPEQEIVLLKNCNIVIVEGKPLTIGNQTFPIGTQIVFVPMTLDGAVRVKNNTMTLKKYIDGIEENIVGFQINLTNTLNRLTQLELWAAQEGYSVQTASDESSEAEEE